MPTANQIRAARTLMARAEVGSVRLLDGRATYHPTANLPKSDQAKAARQLSVNISAPAARGRLEKGNRLRIKVRYSLTARRGPDTNSELALGISALFELVYLIPEDITPTGREVNAFSNTNALLNSWPYWREFTQNAVARMNLPPLTLPLFRLTPAPEKPVSTPRPKGSTRSKSQ
jgi:preprotein translocase subunit SecB